MIFNLKKAHCYYFNEICKIPHGSGNEKRLSDWLMEFARENSFECLQDELYNVIIYKPASKGYEEHPGIIIQAHMDMVCEKESDSLHNFETDALELYVDGDLLRARGTTLGADDGMGCAYMLAILKDNSLSHPFLECCFTTQEEVGLVGAQELKPNYFRARRMINLDGAGEYRTYMSMGGGRKVSVDKNVTFSPANLPTFRLTVNGLLGGHSGGMIDKERANANKLVARILCRLRQEKLGFQLVELFGGTKPNVITPWVEVVFGTKESFSRLNGVIKECEAELAEQFEFSDPGIAIELKPEGRTLRALSEGASGEIAELIALLPAGQISRSMELDIPIASVNMGVVKLEEGRLEIVESVRSALESWSSQLVMEIGLLAEKYGAELTVSNYYPGWRYEKNSPLREIMREAFREMYQKPLSCLAGHGGNECGVFKRLHPDMDIVTSGAIYGNIHTTGEYLDLASFDRAYTFLTYFLGKL